MKINCGKVLLFCLIFLTLISPQTECENAAQQQQLLQHGRYWVLQHYVKAENYADCRNSLALTMQGSYEDIYKLELTYKFPKILGNEMYVSFAVYVPNELHYRRTMKAIAYVRKCTKSLGTPIDPEVIQKYVSFHLYIPLDALTWLIPKNVSHILAMQDAIVCGLDNLQQVATLEKVEQVEKVAKTDMQEHAKIVGRNIAQLAAPSEFIITADPGTYPTFGLMEMLAVINRLCSVDDIEYISRLPVMHMTDLQVAKHILQRGEDLLGEVNELLQQRNPEIYYDEYPRTATVIRKVNEFDCINKNHFKTHFKTLQTRHSIYYSRRNLLPLLPEHETLTLQQAENLRLNIMALQDMKFVVPINVLMLHIDTNQVTRSNKFPMINESVVQQLEIFYK